MSEIIAFPEDSYDFSGDEVGAALAGLVARDVDGYPRSGVFPSTSALISGRGDWQVDVAPFVAVIGEERIVRFGGIDDVDQVTLDPPPVSGGRIDRICWSPTMGTPPLHVVPGSPGTEPVAPGIPGGMLSLGTVHLEASDTSTSQAVLDHDFDFSTTAGGVLIVRTIEDLDEWEATNGSEAFCLADGGGYVRRADEWKPNGAVTGPITYVAAVSGYESGWNPVVRAQYTRAGNSIEVEIQAETDRAMVRIPGPIFVSVPFPFGATPISVDGSGFFLAGPSGARRIYDLKVRQATSTQVVLEFLRTDGRVAERVPPQQAGLAASDLVSWRARFRYTTS